MDHGSKLRNRLYPIPERGCALCRASSTGARGPSRSGEKARDHGGYRPRPGIEGDIATFDSQIGDRRLIETRKPGPGNLHADAPARANRAIREVHAAQYDAAAIDGRLAGGEREDTRQCIRLAFFEEQLHPHRWVGSLQSRSKSRSTYGKEDVVRRALDQRDDLVAASTVREDGEAPLEAAE